jgi:uroporphyrinogen decarboxylase
MLTYRQRVLAAIHRRGFDALPWQFDLTRAVIERLQAHYRTSDVRAALDDHIVFAVPRSLAPPPSGPEAAAGLARDEFGALWRRSPRDYQVGDWGELVDPPLKAPSLDGFRFPDGAQPGRWDGVPALRARHPDHFIVAGGFGLFEAGWSLCGFENYLAYIRSEPDFIEALTERLADFSCAVTAQLAGLPVDAIRFGDDWGFQDRLMIRPELWRARYKRHYRRVYEAARRAGLIVMIHSCGNITDLLPDLIDIGVQVAHPLQPEAMDVAFCQREYGRDLAFWGGLGSQSTLPLGTPDDARREVRQRFDLFRDGGYILAPAGAAPAETPAENIAAIADEARRQIRKSGNNAG